MGKGEKSEFSIQDLNISWEDGSANALLGPSGCGKTTILNIISGLLHPKKGQILFDGKDVTALSPKDRHIAQVFQFPVVYDSMDAFDNLAFPLRNDGVPEKEIKPRVEEIAEILELTDILGISSGKLTAADKQKVSLGRGIVRKSTAVVMLDEPLTVIDPKLKWALRRKLRQVQRQLKVTMIYVTHDQHEALTFADHVTIMKDGDIIQTGTPEELHSEPESPFIGYFIGSPGMNVLDCTLEGETLNLDKFSIGLSSGLTAKLSPHGNQFRLGIRPEFVQVSQEQHEGWFPFTVLVVEDTGAYKVLTLTLEDLKIKARVSELMVVHEDEQVWVDFPEDKFKLFKNEKKIY
jgi:glycerol transport system ATP-binding protein